MNRSFNYIMWWSWCSKLLEMIVDVGSKLLLELCKVCSFSLTSLMRCSPNSVASDLVLLIAASCFLSSGITFEPDTLLSSESSTVASWNGARWTDTRCIPRISIQGCHWPSHQELPQQAPFGLPSSGAFGWWWCEFGKCEIGYHNQHTRWVNT